MTPRDFCYWAQGTFELGRVKSFDADQVRILRQHLELVHNAKFDVTRNPDSLVGADFCAWLSGVLDEVTANSPMSESVVAKISKRLSGTFLHVIDDTFENRRELLQIHQSPVTEVLPEGKPKFEAMC